MYRGQQPLRLQIDILKHDIVWDACLAVGWARPHVLQHGSRRSNQDVVQHRQHSEREGSEWARACWDMVQRCSTGKTNAGYVAMWELAMSDASTSGAMCVHACIICKKLVWSFDKSLGPVATRSWHWQLASNACSPLVCACDIVQQCTWKSASAINFCHT